MHHCSNHRSDPHERPDLRRQNLLGTARPAGGGHTRPDDAPRRGGTLADVRRVQEPGRARGRGAAGHGRRRGHAGHLGPAYPHRDRAHELRSQPAGRGAEPDHPRLPPPRGRVLRPADAGRAGIASRGVVGVRLRGHGRRDRRGARPRGPGAERLRRPSRRRPGRLAAHPGARRRRGQSALDVLHLGNHLRSQGREAHRRVADSRRSRAGPCAGRERRRRGLDRLPLRPYRRTRVHGHDVGRRVRRRSRGALRPGGRSLGLRPPRRDHGRRLDRLLPDVPRGGPQVSPVRRPSRHARAAGAVGRGRPPSRPRSTSGRRSRWVCQWPTDTA